MERGVFEIEAIKQAAAELIGDIEESLVIVDEGKATGSEWPRPGHATWQALITVQKQVIMRYE